MGGEGGDGPGRRQPQRPAPAPKKNEGPSWLVGTTVVVILAVVAALIARAFG